MKHVVRILLVSAICGQATIPVNAEPVSYWKAAVILTPAAGADYASTRYALSRGAVELNPLAQTHTRQIALQGAFIAGGAALVHFDSKRHPKRAKWMLITLVALKFGVAAWNVSR